MKKLCILFAVCLVLTFAVSATHIRGDVDRDGDCNVRDVIIVLKAMLDETGIVGGDYDRDGAIRLLDVVSILKKAVMPVAEEGIEGMTLLEFVSETHSPKAAGDAVMQNMLCISAEEMKGTHDAQFVFANGKAYVVYEANNEMAGDPSTYEKEYAALAVVDLESFTVKSIEKFAYGGQEYANVTLPTGSAFVPRVIRKDANTLRFYFSNIVKDVSAFIYYVDYDLATDTFYNEAHRVQLMTKSGAVDLSAEAYIELFRADGHTCLDSYYGHYLFDIFDIGDTKYLVLNNFGTGQNSLAKFNDTYDCVEIIGNIGGVTDTVKTTESGIMQRKDGTWMAILRNETGDKNYRFSYSEDGKKWSALTEEDFLAGGTTCKPILARFGDYYFMGWNELSRSLFHLAYSVDAKHWTTLYSFYAPTTFQYPEFELHGGQMYFSVTTGSKEEIWFGKLPIREKDGNLYIDEVIDGTEAMFADISSFTLLSDSVQTSDDGTLWKTYVKRGAGGVYFYGETEGAFRTDKLFFMLDTAGTATALGATASPDNLMFRVQGNAVQVQAVYAKETRGYKPLALYGDVQFFVRRGEKIKVGIYLPYDAITAIAPYATFDAAADLYVATYGADADTNKEYTPSLCGMTVQWKKPSTYPVLAADGTLKSR